MSILSDLLGSNSRAELFRLLFENVNKELYLREIHRLSGLSIRPIQQELAKLVKMELLKVRKDGNRIYYRANTVHPLFPEIHNLVEKTVGFSTVLHNILQTEPSIIVAFIFGSVAKKAEQAESDLDLFVVGNLGLRKLTKLLMGISDKIGRLINPHVMEPKEFNQKYSEKNHFISSIINSDKIFVIGNEDELERLVKK